ncbi:MAG: type II toxin-antitoxin system HicA family toxin [Gammaproteobacteria bacterium]|nr:type II toxin-antitoxin system HicA family toxin [Gammaproteobacteria bacterium]
MGRLAGFRYHTIVQRLRRAAEFHRQAAAPTRFGTPVTNCYTTIPNHPGDMPEGTLRAILKQAGVESRSF